MAYTATISHHSISSSPVYSLKATQLQVATAEASRLLGDGFRSHTLTVAKDGEPVAKRKLSSRNWTYL
jgi:hypothetical protein